MSIQCRFRALSLTLLAGLATEAAWAQEIPESFTPVRPQGMGGAFTAIANDENAVWTNPAGIARVRKARSRGTLSLVKAPNIIIGANTASRDFIQGVGRSTDSDVANISDQANDLADKPFWASTSIFPFMMFDLQSTPAIAGLYSTTNLQSIVDADNDDLARTSAVSDLGGLFGWSWTDKSHQVSAGISTRYVARYAYEEKIPLTELADARRLQERIKDGSNRSMGLGVDAGVMWTVADFWFPTVGVSVLNLPTGCKEDYLNPFSRRREKVCGTLFRGSFDNPEAISVIDPTDLRVGLAITPRFGSKLAARVALDVHHIPITIGDTTYGLEGIDFTKQLHAGIEFFVGNPLERSPFTIAMGASQGYFTFGTTVQLGVLALEFSTYGRDISATSKPVEDRRMLLGLSMAF